MQPARVPPASARQVPVTISTVEPKPPLVTRTSSTESALVLS
jgi:hypothetical protein